jgi:hypothetical protein
MRHGALFSLAGFGYVADREADLMPSMLRAQELGTPADGLVRAAYNRCLLDGEALPSAPIENLMRRRPDVDRPGPCAIVT